MSRSATWLQVKALAQRTTCALYTRLSRQQRSLARYAEAAGECKRLQTAEHEEVLEALLSLLQESDPWAMPAPATEIRGTRWDADWVWTCAAELHDDLTKACDRATREALAAAWGEVEEAGSQVALLRRGLALLGARSALAAVGGADEEDMVAVLNMELRR